MYYTKAYNDIRLNINKLAEVSNLWVINNQQFVIAA